MQPSSLQKRATLFTSVHWIRWTIAGSAAVCTALAAILSPTIAEGKPAITDVTVVVANEGDTVVVQEGDSFYKVRLVCVDAPERRQVGGPQSAQYLRQLLAENTPIHLRIVAQEANGRTIAEVFKDNQSINLKLVEDGMAVIDPETFDHCRSQKQAYLQAQAKAQRTKRGVWQQANPVMPWEWRQRNRSPFRVRQERFAQRM